MRTKRFLDQVAAFQTKALSIIKLGTVIILLSFCFGQAKANVSPVTPACVLRAAKLQGIPPHIILGLLKTEGGHIGSETLNKNGSVDLGPMQVNDRVWVPILAYWHFHGDRLMAYEMLRDNGCYSVHIGAWIFRQYLDEAHGNYAEAVGFYNSHNEAAKRAYQLRFAQNFKSLFSDLMANSTSVGQRQ